MKRMLEDYVNRHSLANRLLRVVWDFVWLVFCRPVPNRLSVFFQWRVLWLRLFGAHIGTRCVVHKSAKIWAPWNLTMGDCSCLSDEVVCYSVAPIAIGAHVTVSRGAKLIAASHDITSPSMELTTAPIALQDNAWVAAYAILLPGVTVGEGGVVGAGAVVSRDVAPWTVVAGNPAREIGRRQLKDPPGLPCRMKEDMR